MPRLSTTALLVAFAWSGAICAGSPVDRPVAPAPLTAEELFRPAALNEAEISPDGQNVGAIITDEHDLRHLLILHLSDNKPTGLLASRDLEISGFRWLGRDRILFNVTRDKLYSWGLYTATLDNLDSYHSIDNYDATVIVGVPRRRPGHVLVWVVQSSVDFGRPGPLLELDCNLTYSRFEAPNQRRAVVDTYPEPKPGTVVGWMANQDGDLALGFTWFAGRTHVFRYLRDRHSWREAAIDGSKVKVMALDRDDRFAWVVTRSTEQGFALRRCDLDTGYLDPPVLTDARYDIGYGRLYFSPGTGALVGASYVQRQSTTVWLSAPYASIQAAVDKLCRGTDNLLVDCDRSERKFLFLLTGPQQPGAYVLLDLDAKTLNRIATAAPWLAGRPLLPVQPVSFYTRDHVKLEGYLTLPSEASAQHPVPLVVLAHGGPWVRDTLDFNPEVQFLASRGYAVLQPNYRGSSGYSPAISYDHQFDFLRMHDDVTDATRAMLRSPFIDPHRVAIMGGSFGGYLALAGVAFEKDLYRCAITECGVFDWERQIKSKRDAGRPGEYEQLLDELGHPGRDHARLEEISPLTRVDQIHVPVLIAHGTDDHIVDVAQSKKLAAELRKHGVPFETFFRPLEGHGFFNYKDQIDYYHRVEAFLAANLGGVSLAPPR